MSAVMVAQSARGQVLYCPACRIFHVEFGNMHLSLWIEHLVEFWEAVRAVDGPRMEAENRHTRFRRKILVPVRHGPVNILFSAGEMQELTDLLGRAVDRAVLPSPEPAEAGNGKGEIDA